MARSSPNPRWKRRAEARPEEILDAALEEFTEQGFDAARMEDVAKRAGLSKAGVYLYFESKEALLKALIEAKVAPLAQNARLLAQAGEADPVGTMRNLANALAHRIADPKTFAVPRLVIGISARFPEIIDFYRTHVVEVAREAFETIFTAGVKKGVFRPIDPRAAARAFIGPILFEAMWTHVLRGESALSDPPALVDAHLDVLLEGLRA